MIKAWAVLLGLVLLAGCLKSYPPGYEIADYCQQDSDCVRLNKCCDCGMGTYVNTYHQQKLDCPGPRCMCAIMNTRGACQDNRCVAVQVLP